jgi:hypothetical protein
VSLGPPSMSTALDLIVAAASSESLGQQAFWDGRVTTAGAASLTDADLITGSQDSAWRNYWAYVVSGQNTGQERFITASDLANGILRFTRPLPYPLAVGDRYLLFRDGRWNQWLGWLNETARNIHYPVDVYVPGVADQLRYTLPEPVQRAGWLNGVMVGPAGASFTTPSPQRVRWARVDPLNVQGDLYLVLSRAIAPSQQLLFRCRPPYAYEHQAPYATTTSVLVPPPDVPANQNARPPTRLFVMGTVWRCLQTKVNNLTGTARQIWQQNLESHARQYAEACKEWQVEEVGRELGYEEDWYGPWGGSWRSA